ncbi:MAG: NAD(P)-dependent oxidoreductase [Gammaproteobacteria bacterium]|nr:NAD(P)-dependent oxidoreductase [Gammaproteobacteria bacterium]NNC58027.1 NAD(P)-dependent oxidoreductase [Woeseiaceae bacterium]
MSIERVLVTGAGGFIGSHLVDDQLAKGRIVTAFDINLDRLVHQADNPDCKLVTGDVRDKDQLESLVSDQQIVFHLASAHLEVNKPPSYFEETNVDAVAQLVDICQRHDVDRLVHCSSVGVFGSLKSLPADETTECHPTIAYEKTKLAGEKALLDAVTDLDYVILRPAWVYGPRCLRTLKLLQAIKRKKFIKVGFKKTFRHPVYITDMLAAFELAATRPKASGQTMIIGASEALPLNQLITEVAQAVGTDFRPPTIPLTIMAPACFVVEKLWGALGKEPPFSTRSLKFFTESSAFDISKAREVLDYHPEVSIAEGMARTAKYFSNEGLL